MKISPVIGTAIGTIGSDSGVTPDKVARAKAVLEGRTPEEVKPQEKEVIPQIEPLSNKVIKMRTNANPETLPEIPKEEAAEAQITPESVISDTSAQTKPVPEAIQAVSPQIAALAKQKRAVQVKEQELAAQKTAIDGQIARAKALEERIKGGQALSVLQELGVTYDDLTSQILGRQNTPDPIKFKEEILEGVRKELAAKDTAQEEAVFDYMSKNVNRMTFASSDFPFIKAGKAQGKVMEMIKRSWKEQGEVVDEEEACTFIEAELKEEAKAYAKILGTEVTTPSPAEPQPKSQPTPVSRGTGVKTLTNRDSARSGMNRRQRAIAAALGQLK